MKPKVPIKFSEENWRMIYKALRQFQHDYPDNCRSAAAIVLRKIGPWGCTAFEAGVKPGKPEMPQ